MRILQPLIMKKALITIGIILSGLIGWFVYEKPQPPFGAVKDNCYDVFQGNNGYDVVEINCNNYTKYAEKGANQPSKLDEDWLFSIKTTRTLTELTSDLGSPSIISSL